MVVGSSLVTKSCPTLVTPWTIVHQAPLSMGFPGKNTGVGCYFLFQGTFPGIEPQSPALQADSYRLSYKGSLINCY